MAAASTNTNVANTGSIQQQQQKCCFSKSDKILGNYTTPLMGTFINLPEEPVLLECPSCHIKEMSRIEKDLKPWAKGIDNIAICLFHSFCCCFCFSFKLPCNQKDRHHYCPNCGCYYGRAIKHKLIKIKHSSEI